jgi:bifunctional non-homologous end joining protein LigD
VSVLDALDPEARLLLRAGDNPAFHDPMLATLHDDVFSDPDWIFEVKLDGVRALVTRDGDEVHLVSRSRRPMDPAYPELVESFAAAGPDRYVVDGEVVAFDGGRPSFARLQPRIGLQDPDRARRTGIAVKIYLFDVLHVAGCDVTELALRDRKVLLREMFDYADPIRFSTHRNEHGREFFDEACRRGWEGLIAKRADSRYRSGRSRDWLKLKCVRRQELVVVGFTEPKGSRTGFGALLLGYHDDAGTLRYAGKVGTGFDEAALRRIREQLGDIERDDPPVADDVRERGAHWVEPRLVAEVGFTEWTDDGRLRHPRFVGLRDDKEPSEVVREEPAT